MCLPLPRTRTKPGIAMWWQNLRARLWTGWLTLSGDSHLLAFHYQAIKGHFLSAFGRSPFERSKMLLDWPGMGDGTPSALLGKMLACLPAGEDSEHILFKVLFLRQLPADVQDNPAHFTALTIHVMAQQADTYFALSGTRLNLPSSLVGNVDVIISGRKCWRWGHWSTKAQH